MLLMLHTHHCPVCPRFRVTRIRLDGSLHWSGCDVEACNGSDTSGCFVVQVRAHLQNLEKGQKQVCHVFEEWTSALNPGPVSALL